MSETLIYFDDSACLRYLASFTQKAWNTSIFFKTKLLKHGMEWVYFQTFVYVAVLKLCRMFETLIYVDLHCTTVPVGDIRWLIFLKTKLLKHAMEGVYFQTFV